MLQLDILSHTPEGVYGRTLVMAYYKRTVRPRVERTAKAATRSDREQDEETLFYPYGIPLAAQLAGHMGAKPLTA